VPGQARQHARLFRKVIGEIETILALPLRLPLPLPFYRSPTLLLSHSPTLPLAQAKQVSPAVVGGGIVVSHDLGLLWVLVVTTSACSGLWLSRPRIALGFGCHDLGLLWVLVAVLGCAVPHHMGLVSVWWHAPSEPPTRNVSVARAISNAIGSQ
jgi:hypothetical protein